MTQGEFEITLPLQEPSIRGLQSYSDGCLRVPPSVIEEIVDCLAEVLKMIEIGVVRDSGASPVRDRCFTCMNRTRELKQMLLALLEG